MAESEIPAIAVLSYGRWIGLCPTDANAMLLEPGQTRFECGSPGPFGADGTTCDVRWPPNPDEIALAMIGLPIEDQNWTPVYYFGEALLSVDATIGSDVAP